jgi:hypothetical protein
MWKNKEGDSLPTLSILCHFHGPLWKPISQSTIITRARLGTGTICPRWRLFGKIATTLCVDDGDLHKFT